MKYLATLISVLYVCVPKCTADTYVYGSGMLRMIVTQAREIGGVSRNFFWDNYLVPIIIHVMGQNVLIIIIFITFKTLHVTAVNAYRQVSRDHVFCLQVLWTYIFVTKQVIAALYVIGHRTLHRVVSSNIYLYNYSIFILNCIITCMFSSFF